MITFIITIGLLLLGAFSWAVYVSTQSERNKFISLLPWWVLGYGVSFAMFCPLAFFRIYGKAEAVVFCVIFAVALIFACLIIACLIASLIKKQFRNSGRIIGIGAILIIYSFVVSLFAGMGEGSFDKFGKRHPIPEGMEYEETHVSEEWERRSHSQEEWDSVVIDRKFLLLGSLGQYYYMVYMPPTKEEGDIYLKMYEATTNLPLSEASIRNASLLHIMPSDTAKIYEKSDRPYRSCIMVTEGEWGDYYAARTELWFKPSHGGEEQLIYSKIYRIEGHSR